MVIEKAKTISLFIVFSIITFLSVEFLIPLFTNPNLFCLVPRETRFLSGILLMHFDHANMSHLGTNIIPFLVLSSLIILRKNISYLFTFYILSFIISGSLLWILGQSGCHIGASAIIFALWGFIVSQGIFTKCPKDIIIGFLIGFVYISFIYGLSPLQNGVSWDGHLYGLISGVLIASFLRNKEKNTK